MNDDVRRARTAFVRVGLIIPIAMLAVSMLVVALWLPEVPDPAATHWGEGGADGFAPRWTLLLNPLIGVGVVLLLAAIALLSSRASGGSSGGADAGRPQWSAVGRGLGATNLGVGGLISLLAIGTTDLQRGLSDAADAADIGGWLAAGLVSMVVLGLIGWFAQPGVRTAPAPAASATSVAISATERAAWFGSVSMARAGRIVLGAGLAVAAIATVLSFAAGEPGEGPSATAWIMLLTLVLLVGVLAFGFAFRVRISARGLHVRSMMGWPSTRIPLGAIEKVEITRVDPFGEFGGWGWRIGLDGRRGVVMRRGEALQVTHVGKAFVITVDGAAEAAAVLETLRRSETGGENR
ncbi:DUF1648 domain-containing protein [Microbacterium sp.]|uniref:DUF1648 domain-containing protein n=1 Tax=Microbacterium sp. TaxID=51671 RepID=UPI0039E4F91B